MTESTDGFAIEEPIEMDLSSLSIDQLLDLFNQISRKPWPLTQDVVGKLATAVVAVVGTALKQAYDQRDDAVFELEKLKHQVRIQVADDIKAHAESIGWYEGGGVWAEAIEVARNGYQADDDA